MSSSGRPDARFYSITALIVTVLQYLPSGFHTALNTILAACSKAGDFSAARELLDRMKNAEFLWPGTSHPIMPDEISYSLLLSSCRDPQMAKSILKEVRTEFYDYPLEDIDVLTMTR